MDPPDRGLYVVLPSAFTPVEAEGSLVLSRCRDCAPVPE